MYMTPTASPREGYAYRWNQWKLAVGGISCDPEGASFNCSAPQLYNLEEDKEENHDLSLKEPEIFAAILRNFSIWHESVLNSMANESMCAAGGGNHGNHQPFPKNPKPSSACTATPHMAQSGSDFSFGTVQTAEECCGACLASKFCHAADFNAASEMRPTWDGQVTGGECHLKEQNHPKPGSPSQTSLVPTA